MTVRIILASASAARNDLLRAAGITFESRPARIDEPALRAALAAENASPRDVADALAEFKARRVAERDPGALVIGCDQVLEFRGDILTKADTAEAANAQLRLLAGQTHQLHSAVVIYENAAPVWRHISTARMTMRPLSDEYRDSYVARNWDTIRHAVGGYLLEREGVCLFSAIEGDYFTVLGLPLTQVLNYLVLRQAVAS